MWNKVLGWLLGLDDVEVLRIEGAGLAASWAQGSGLFWVCFAAVCLVVLAFFFYLKFQNRGTPASRQTVDAIECAAWSAKARRSVITWSADDVVEVTGELHRRFFRAGGAVASRVEVEMASGRVIRRAASG